jgi:aryl-alcohol dehydrogenase-like predicted oxidoreductase
METFSRTLPVETLQLETLQPPYHLFRREIEAETLPYAATEKIGVLVHGSLAHGLLGGRLSMETQFVAGDWRATNEVFRGAISECNLKVVDDLRPLAVDELGITLGQLAIAWTRANPAVHVAIVGTRDTGHVDEALAAADIDVDQARMQRIDEIMRGAVPVAGPSPETV